MYPSLAQDRYRRLVRIVVWEPVEWIRLLRNKGQMWYLANIAVNLWGSLRNWGDEVFLCAYRLYIDYQLDAPIIIYS